MTMAAEITAALQAVATEMDAVRAIAEAAGGGGAAAEVAKVFLLGQTNLNNATSNSIVQLTTAGLVGGIAGMTVDAVNHDIELPAGNYKFQPFINLTGSTARQNLGWQLNVNGSLYQTYNGGNYNRATSGHNEVNDAFTDYFELSSPGNIEFYGKRMAASGVVTLATNSFFIIEKI